MKYKILALACVCSLFSVAHAQAARDSASRPCIKATVQADQSNTATVNQDCDENLSRTIQAGQSNTAHTTQKGQRNDNAVEQLNYEGPKRRAAPQRTQPQ